MTYTNAANFYALNKGDFTADYFSFFQLGGTLASGYSSNVWSVLEDIAVATPPPQWTAIVAVSNAERRKRFSLI